jgi:L-fuculose-phosphate aldolase
LSDTGHEAIRRAIVETAREMNRKGINQGTAGNVSHRVEGGLLITPTSLPYDTMEPEDVVLLRNDGSYAGRHRPSSEWRFHRDILSARPDVNVVLHNHATFATTLACHERGIPPFHYMTAIAGGHDIRVSRYATFGTQALSDAVLEALEGRLACLMGHHGLLTIAPTLDTALWLAVEIETLSRMYVHALALGEPPRLPADEMDRVLEQMRRMSYGQAPDLDGINDTPRGEAA